LEVLRIKDIGKDDIKSWGFSPDALIQMAYQLAFKKMHGHTPATYESANTKTFLAGRTETIRSATNESNTFVAAFLDPKETNQKKKEALKKAVNMHVKLTNEAGNGLGFDRHLFALKNIAKKAGVATPQLFEDEMFSHMNDIEVSTSNLTQPLLDIFGFGAVSPKGYGIGYNVRNDSLNFVISNFRSNGVTDSSLYSQSLQSALSDIRSLFSD